ncbi:hypothetical protein EMMF5_005166 [Cystobasidiomycetes sp. EMM_F5]
MESYKKNGELARMASAWFFGSTTRSDNETGNDEGRAGTASHRQANTVTSANSQPVALSLPSSSDTAHDRRDSRHADACLGTATILPVEDEDSEGWVEHSAIPLQSLSTTSDSNFFFPDPLSTDLRIDNPTLHDRHVWPVSTAPKTSLQDDHLRSLTERKLEKAVLGRAVGLRQMVLLSNAFASRLPSKSVSPNTTSPPTPATSNVIASDRLRYEDRDLEVDIDSLEDEMVRKRREEDWLDSVLDEMLTDEWEDRTEEEDSGQQMLSREPYVHLSLRQHRDVHVQPTPVAPQETTTTSAHIHHAIVSNLAAAFSESVTVRDSGFLEPASIPLPASPERSPDSSAHSQQSDDDSKTTVMEDTEGFNNDDDDVEYLTSSGLAFNPHSSLFDLNVAMPSTHIDTSTRSIPLSGSFVNPPTPELAYSVNSFFSNLSTSPSASVQLLTPSSSPPVLSTLFTSEISEQYPMASTSRRDLFIPFEHDLAGRLSSYHKADSSSNDDEIPAMDDIFPPESTDAELDERVAFIAPNRPVRLSSSTEMIRYQPPMQERVRLEETYRIRNLSFTSNLVARDVWTKAHTPDHRLKPGDPVSRMTGSSTSSEPESLISYAAHADTSKTWTDLKLPLVLPYEVVKSLYDNVDFGVPPARSPMLSPIQSPKLAAVHLPTSASFGGLLNLALSSDAAAAGGHGEPPSPTRSSSSSASSNDAGTIDSRTATSRPNLPSVARVRSKSLSGFNEVATSANKDHRAQSARRGFNKPSIDEDRSEHLRVGGSLLFTSLGLLFQGGSSRSDLTTDKQTSNDRPDRRFRFDAHPFGRGIVQEWDGRHSASSSSSSSFGRAGFGNSASGHRSDSRSPSRLRLHQYHSSDMNGDFDFGSA